MTDIKTVVEEIARTVSEVPYEEEEGLAERILKAKHVYVAGCGRSGLMVRAFAMRLMHMGISTYVVGEIVTPGFQAGDLLIIVSGSGTTGSLVTMAKKAKTIGGQIALVTIYPDSVIAQMADSVLRINAPTSKGKKIEGVTSVQPMGSLFEESVLLVLDYVILILMDKKNLTGEEMFKRHANLE